MSDRDTSSDPLLRAVSLGDAACPDGAALARLGELVRAHSRRDSRDLSAGVRAKLALPDLSAGDLDDAIDATWNGSGTVGRPVGGLDQLQALVRAASELPAPVDLSERVRAKLNASHRVSTVTQMDAASRWRIWTFVVAGHVAAALVVLAFSHHEWFGPNRGNADALPSVATHDATDGEVATATATANANAPTPKADVLPSQWQELRTRGLDLFVYRRFPELREQARHRYGLDAAKPTVEAGLRWLCAQQNPDGAFASASSNSRDRDDTDRAVATQSFALLALAGEGLGDAARVTALKRGAAWLVTRLETQLEVQLEAQPDIRQQQPQPALGQTSSSLAALALVESGLLLNDRYLRTQAERRLALLDGGLPLQPGAAGVGGFALLAIETAKQGGLTVPARLVEQARRTLGRTLPTAGDDAGRIGLAAFARLIYGFRATRSTGELVERLTHLLPGGAPGSSPADNHRLADPLAWFFASLALREAGGDAWNSWREALCAQLLPRFVTAADGTARVPAAAVRYADNDVLATSLALLNLQAPYRYLPLAAN